MAKRRCESGILKVTLRNRANQPRNFTKTGRDYSIPVPYSILLAELFFSLS